MRVCHVSPHLPPDQAANALLPAQLGAWQTARGDEVRFVTHAPAQGGTRVTGDTFIIEVPRRQGTGLTRLLRLDALAVAKSVDRALESIGIARGDVLHLHSNGLIIEAAARFAQQRELPYVLTLYGTEIWHYRKRWPIDLFTAAYRGATAVTFYSRFLRERAVELGLNRSGLSVVYPAVSDRFAPQSEATRAEWRASLGIREPRVILNVKRLHELAGQKYLIEAFAMIARDRRDVRLVICGTGALKESLEAQAASLGVTDRVTFTGLVSNDTVAQYASVADVFALPSLLEALPTVAVEALAAGTPVVSADHPGGRELHEVFGPDVAVVPRENAAELAHALSAVLNAPRRVGAQTLATVRARFGAPAVLAAYDSVYNELP